MKYNPALDGIRALSVVMVMAFHAKVPGFGGGFLGVDVFFVLSGFLITQILVAEYDRTGTIEIGKFYMRRLRRLYPALLLMLTAYVLIAPFMFPEVSVGKHLFDAAATGLYLGDYTRTFGLQQDVLSHGWSLAIEEQFYLLWPVVLLVLVKLPKNRAVGILIGLAVAVTLLRIYHVVGLGNDWRTTYDRFDTHSSGLILGCIIGLVGKKLPPYAAALGFFGLFEAMVRFRFIQLDTTLVGFTLAEISAAVIIMSQPKWLGVSALAFAGRLSYGLYLWHYPIMFWMRGQQWGWLETFLVGGSVAFAAAWLSYAVVEVRFRKPLTEAAAGNGPQPAVVPRPQ